MATTRKFHTPKGYMLLSDACRLAAEICGKQGEKSELDRWRKILNKEADSGTVTIKPYSTKHKMIKRTDALKVIDMYRNEEEDPVFIVTKEDAVAAWTDNITSTDIFEDWPDPDTDDLLPLVPLPTLEKDVATETPQAVPDTVKAIFELESNGIIDRSQAYDYLKKVLSQS